MSKTVTLRKNHNIITPQMFKGSDVKRLIIKKSVEIFEDECFSNLSSLETVEFTSKVLKMGNGLFKNCKKLKNITLP